MRASAVGGRWTLDDLAPELEASVEKLGFVRDGASFVRTFPRDAPHVDAAAARFVIHADALVRQAAGLEPVPWATALETVIVRAGTEGWWLVGSAALAVRGAAVEPRDVDIVAEVEGCVRLADALADLLVEPLAVGDGFLGTHWFRAFASARVECLGGVRPAVDDGEPSDFGPVAAARLETVTWRGHAIRVPPLDLQLQVSCRRGLTERARLIEKLMV
jgi:hypothetical protein